MINYARSDTHYLLYIFDVMRNEMLERSDNLMKVSLERSKETSLKTYEKPIYDSENGEGTGGWKNLLRKHPEALNSENFAVFRAIHGWRDHIARLEDESPTYVMPTHILFKFCRFMPTTAHEIISECSPVPPLIRIYAEDISKLIEETLRNIREKVILQSTKHAKIFIKPVASIIEEKKDFGFGKPSIYLRTTSTCFGNLFFSKDIPKSISIAAKIEQDLFLVAPSLESVHKTSNTIVEEEVIIIKEDDVPKIVKKELANLSSKRKEEDLTEIASIPLASKKIKDNRFDYQRAQIEIEKGDKSVASSMFDLNLSSIKSQARIKRTKGKGRSGRL